VFRWSPRARAFGFTGVDHRTVVPVTQCAIVHPTVHRAYAQAADGVTEIARDDKLNAAIRSLMVRADVHTGQAMAALIGQPDAPTQLSTSWAQAMGSRTVDSVWFGRFVSGKDPVLGATLTHTSGSRFITTRLGHVDLEVGPETFLQVNSAMAESLYEIIETEASLTGSETVWDVYSGVGSIGLYLARHARRVIAMESVAASADCARRNAQLNGADNFVSLTGSADELTTDAPDPDVVVLDPPRSGAGPRALDAIARRQPDRIVYCSCDPTTLARDVRLLADRGYACTSVHPVDLFPQTYHVEAVATLRLESAV
jgi:23S rRNA (uracil1939-C5)-methyltransferase